MQCCLLKYSSSASKIEFVYRLNNLAFGKQNLYIYMQTKRDYSVRTISVQITLRNTFLKRVNYLSVLLRLIPCKPAENMLRRLNDARARRFLRYQTTYNQKSTTNHCMFISVHVKHKNLATKVVLKKRSFGLSCFYFHYVNCVYTTKLQRYSCNGYTVQNKNHFCTTKCLYIVCISGRARQKNLTYLVMKFLRKRKS